MTPSPKPTEIAKPCPFCGEQPPAPRLGKRRANKLGPGRYHYFVRHGWCGSEGAHGLTEKQAIDNWNRRPNPETQIAIGKCTRHGNYDIAHFPMCPGCEADAEVRQADIEGAYRKAAAMCWDSIPFVCASKQFFYERIVECLSSFIAHCSPVESVPVEKLRELEAELRNKMGHYQWAAYLDCADRLSAIVKEYSK